MHFCERKVLYPDYNFTEVCSWGSNWQLTSIGLDNGLAPDWRQAIIWTNVDSVDNVDTDAYMRHWGRWVKCSFLCDILCQNLWFLSSFLVEHLLLVVKYVFPINNTRVTAIVDRSHSSVADNTSCWQLSMYFQLITPELLLLLTDPILLLLITHLAGSQVCISN